MTRAPEAAVTPDGSASAGDPDTRRGSLLRAEVHRFASRRFIRWLLLLALAAYLVIVTLVAVTQYAKVGPDALAEAQQRAEAAAAEQREFREQCLNDPGRPDDVPVEEYCGPEVDAADFPVEQFINPAPFRLADGLPDGALVVGVTTAMLAFLLGATYVGAEWSTRSMVALLFWEPRRLRVMGVKLAVTAAAAAALGALAQGLWWATAEALAATRGTRGDLPPEFWPDVLWQQGRAVLFVMLAALLGFGIANLIRNTGAALGVGFVYFAIVESAVRAFRPRWQEWLLTDNAAALLLPDGHRIFLYEDMPTSGGGNDFAEPQEIVLSNLHGGLVLGIVTAVVVVVGVVLFQRRDLH